MIKRAVNISYNFSTILIIFAQTAGIIVHENWQELWKKTGIDDYKGKRDIFRRKSPIAMHKHGIKDILFDEANNKINMIIFYEQDMPH